MVCVTWDIVLTLDFKYFLTLWYFNHLFSADQWTINQSPTTQFHPLKYNFSIYFFVATFLSLHICEYFCFSTHMLGAYDLVFKFLATLAAWHNG